MQEAINGWVCSQDIWVCFVSGLCGGELCRSARPAAASAMQAAPSEGIAGAEGSASPRASQPAVAGAAVAGRGRGVALGWDGETGVTCEQLLCTLAVCSSASL